MRRRAWRAVTAGVLTAVLSAVVAGCGTSSPGPRAGAFYVALGDSYTAFPVTAPQIGGSCLRSNGNYPHLVAATLNYALTDVSCAGADTKDLVGSQMAGVAPQLAALGPSTRLVTVGIGANNDAISSVLLIRCILERRFDPSGRPCELKTAGWASTAFLRLRPALVASYQAIKARAPKARVIAIGYPQILGDSGACAKYPVAAGDVAYVNALNFRLNQTVQVAAAQAGIAFLNIAPASMSHGICSASPWVNGPRLLPGIAIPMHPLPAEQQAVAALLERSLGGLSNP